MIFQNKQLRKNIALFFNKYCLYMNVLYFELSNITSLFFYMETYILNNEWISVFSIFTSVDCYRFGLQLFKFTSLLFNHPKSLRKDHFGSYVVLTEGGVVSECMWLDHIFKILCFCWAFCSPVHFHLFG